ncbi:hypothetical protein J6590_043632 [Homalodisca vitripennis]|nr:hypothetical protein J6590_043632 [Homalodisca vitripennis]
MAHNFAYSGGQRSLVPLPRLCYGGLRVRVCEPTQTDTRGLDDGDTLAVPGERYLLHHTTVTCRYHHRPAPVVPTYQLIIATKTFYKKYLIILVLNV